MKIAIIGASNNPKKYGNKAVRAYASAGWEVFPVNPNEKEVEGLKCYPSVRDIPGKVDFASLYVPPNVGMKVIQEIAEKGIRKAYLNPGSESKELVEKAKELGIEPLLACSILAIGKKPDDF